MRTYTTRKCSKCNETRLLTQFHRGSHYCKECKRNYDRGYHKGNEDKLAEQARDRRRTGKERVRAQERRSYQKHHEKRTKQMAAYYVANLDEITEQHRKYRKTSSGKLTILVSNQRRRALLANSERNDLTRDQTKILLERAATCSICEESYNNARLARRRSLDHIIPVSKGGHHTLSNIRVVHVGCNSRKSNRMLSA